MNTPHDYTDERILAELSRTLTLHHLTLSDSAWEVEDASPEAKIQFARAFLAALPQSSHCVESDQKADPYARLKAYNEAGARIRCGKHVQWEEHYPWAWDCPVEDYEVHPDDLPICPEYAPAKPWALPAPPAGRRWHREDWTADMLPEGWRPLLEGEDMQPEDEAGNDYRLPDGSPPHKWERIAGLLRSSTHMRTRRPLPGSAEPEQAKSDDGPAWIPHDGGPCPIKDEEVEEFEFKQFEQHVTKYGPWAVVPPSGLKWSVIKAYRVTKPAPGHSPQPATFEAHGKTWTRHTPGDPCPCDPEAFVEVIFKDGDFGYHVGDQGKDWSWTDTGGNDDIVGWRYADEPAQAPAAPTEMADAIKRERDDLRFIQERNKPWAKKAQEMLDEGRWAGHTYMEGLVTELEEARAKITALEAQASQPPSQPWMPRPGDVVQLKSGGPEMTVAHCGMDGAATCDWFDDIGHPYSKAFLFTSLQPAKEEARP